MNRRQPNTETNTSPAVLLSDRDAAARYSLGVTHMRKIAEQANAVVMIGRCRRNNIRKLDEFFGLTA